MTDNKYHDMMVQARKEGGLLDGLLAAQDADGCVTEAAIREAAEAFDMTPAAVYDTVSFYGMLSLTPKCAHEISICGGASCHVDGSESVRAALEEYLGLSMGQSRDDKSCSLNYMACQGRCGDGPVVMIDGQTYDKMTADNVIALLKEGGIR